MIWDQSKAPDGSALLRNKEAASPPVQLDGEQQEYLLAIFDAPITIQRVFVELCDNLNAGAVLSELSSQEKDPAAGEWLTVSQADWQRRLGLNAKEQREAIRLLLARGFIEAAKGNTRSAYRLRWDAIDHAVRTLAKRRASEHPTVSMQ
jgi:hypothetical protein